MEDPEERPTAGLDDWGRDPSVRAMRRMFAAMEAAQKVFINHLGLSLFDDRLRRWRERALGAFEASWGRSAAAGLELSETEAGVLYVHCLGKIMARDGVDVPAGVLPKSEKVAKIVREVFP